MNKKVKFGDYIAEIKGKGEMGKDVKFGLRYEEVKHIRRTLKSYDNYYDRLYPKDFLSDDLTKRLYFKFLNFGKMRKRLTSGTKKKKVKKLVLTKGKICSYPGCKEKERLTIDHIKKVSVIDDANVDENLQFLCPKHHLLKNLKSHLFHKEIEIKKLKKRIQEINNKGETDCLGFHVLSKDKFDDLDGDYEEEVFYDDK